MLFFWPSDFIFALSLLFSIQILTEKLQLHLKPHQNFSVPSFKTLSLNDCVFIGMGNYLCILLL